MMVASAAATALPILADCMSILKDLTLAIMLEVNRMGKFRLATISTVGCSALNRILITTSSRTRVSDKNHQVSVVPCVLREGCSEQF
jgi:hypothetical protein